jgi:hypothetical protein
MKETEFSSSEIFYDLLDHCGVYMALYLARGVKGPMLNSDFKGKPEALDSFAPFVKVNIKTRKQVLTLGGLIRWQSGMGSNRAAKDISFLFELLRDSDGVVPVDSVLEMVYGDIDEVRTSKVEVPGYLGTLAIVKARLLLLKIFD